MALYYRILWWVLEIVTHVTFIACMLGIGVLVLWITGHRPCLKCRRREIRERHNKPMPIEEVQQTADYLAKYKRLIDQEHNK